ncbi:hypothetical protein C8J56DRAFT_810291 [Mycena floridula]|nr:hypothetical protein C8J56DRAFT_810291 [Mycena floridula]
MHLIWENVVKNLILLWTGNYKGLDEGAESYHLSEAIWQGIGKATAAAGSTIPSAYGARVPNIADSNFVSAEMYSIWTLYLGPVLLHRRFTNEKYYNHFIDLVALLNICLQFEISTEEVEIVRIGFIEWVEKYERFYYQDDPERLSTCPVTVHGLLHIAPGIISAGPIWCYWAFPMERYCGFLGPAIKSRRHPFASLDRFILEGSQLTQIKTVYNKAEELSLRPPANPSGLQFVDPAYPSCRLLPPRVGERPTNTVLKPLFGALATRFSVRLGVIQHCIKYADIEEWGRVQRIDSDAGDTIRSAGLGTIREDSRDATYVRYEMLVDLNARHKHRRPDFQPETFYGQLQHIYTVQFTSPCPELSLNEPTTIIMAAMRSCKLDKSIKVPKLDIHFSSGEGQMHVVDITSVQALIGRVKYRDNIWALIDRSGSLARATFDLEAD